MGEAKRQHCDFCGEYMGDFDYSRRFHGPLVCGKSECLRYGREEERAAYEDRRQAANDDEFGRYP